jgi:hypothetical protein
MIALNVILTLAAATSGLRVEGTAAIGSFLFRRFSDVCFGGGGVWLCWLSLCCWTLARRFNRI